MYYKGLTGRGKGAWRCWTGPGGGREAKGGILGSGAGLNCILGSAAGAGGAGRSGWGRRGRRTGPDNGNANTCDWGSGKLIGLQQHYYL